MYAPISMLMVACICMFGTIFTSYDLSHTVSDDVETQLRKILHQQAKSWNAGDIEAFMQPYWKSPELTFSSSGKTTRGWQATLERYERKYATREQMGQLKFDNFEFTSLGDSAALLLGTWQLKRNNDSPSGNFSLVCKRIDGQWTIIHDHTSSLEEDQ